MSKYLKVLIGIFLVCILSACRYFLRPKGDFIEQVLGSYNYSDSTTSYNGRFLLHSYKKELSFDLYGPFHILAGSVRLAEDSALVYLPLEQTLAILNVDDELPFEGWSLPIAFLAAAYLGQKPPKPDSSFLKQDSMFIFKNGIEYIFFPDEELSKIRTPEWFLERNGRMEINPSHPRRIRFVKPDSELQLEFGEAEFVEKSPEQIFKLVIPEGIEVLDFR